MIRFRDDVGYSSELLFSFLQPQGTVLEIGCGEARNSIYMANRGFNVIGIDISIEYMKKAMLPIQTLQADAYCLPFKASSFDCILCSEVLEHLEHPEFCIKESYRVLRNGGVAVFACPTLNIPIKALIPIARKLAGIPLHSYQEHVHVFSEKQLSRMLSCYFDIIAVKHVEFLFVLQRRLGIGYSLESYLPSLSARFPLLHYFSGGAWLKVRKTKC
jgi:ubiquinone/menaquinone biosynthesis C-methylase UbiE